MPYRSPRKSSASSPASPLEPLESRRLMAAAPAAALDWGTIPRLVRQDVAAAEHPTITGKGQAVAVIDTGIDYTNPLLGGGFGPGHRVVGGWDFVSDDADPMDTYGHGTEVAGVIGASGFDLNGTHYAGVAPECNLVALRVDAADDLVPDTRIEEALKWVIDHRAEFNIVAANISFGSGHYAGTHTSVYSDELKTLRGLGVFVAASSGNNGVSKPYGVEYPAADANVFAVGAVDAFDVITEFTERGPNLDLLAPGDDVPTTSLGPEPFDTASGTSFAVPFVTGAVALMRQANSSLKVRDICSIFRAGSIENLDGDSEFGAVTNLTYQRLDLANAIDLALARRPAKVGNTTDVATAGNGNDLAYDANGVLHMAYYDSVERTLMYVTRGSDRAISAPQRIDASGNDVGGYCSVAVDNFARPSVAYFDGTAGDLRFAHFDGTKWNVQTVDARGSVGLYPSLAYDHQDRPVISYFHKTRGDLRVARFDGTAWNIVTVDSKNIVGRSTDLTVNGKTGELAVAYDDSSFGRLKLARNAGQGWTRGVVDGVTRGVTHTSVAFDTFDRPAVSYYDIYNADLKFAAFNGSSWDVQRLANKAAQGLYTQLAFGSDGKANIFYYNRKSNAVVRLTGGIGQEWTSKVLQTGGGRYIAADTNPVDRKVTYSWFEPGAAKLRVADV
ncbi:MAG TPA: S8 family serine peptidase [Tepidisphaeraceae bacterium]|nr:S8 family serine peptidase [Tepidisphaeraceae bacterium]